MDWNQSLNSLIIWADNRGYHVEFVKGGDDSICYISKLIIINSSSPLETQVIRLLHECGHALIFDNGSVFDFKGKRNYDENSVAHKVFTVIEEAEAWRRGKELSTRLNIPLDENIWERSMVKALKKHINWASDLKQKDEINED